MAINENVENFNKQLLQDSDENTSETSSDVFSWKQKKNLNMHPESEGKAEEAFSYHPVSSFSQEPEEEPQDYEDIAEDDDFEREEDPEEKEETPARPAFDGKNKDFSNQNFAGRDLRGVDFTGSILKNADFSGARLDGAIFENADLSGVCFAGAFLKNANFRKAKMHNVILDNADIENAILLEADLDNLTIEELQELIEYLAVNFPHKLNLARMNLSLFDLSKVELKNLDLRGVDFTGVDFTNINIMELDLSQCIITPKQIEQALGHPPSALELRKILAPKKKAKKKAGKGFDLMSIFMDDGKEFGVWDFTKDAVTIEQLLKAGKILVNKIAPKPKIKDEEIMNRFEQSRSELPPSPEKEKADNELRRAIEENKRSVLQQKKLKKIQEEYYEEQKKHEAENKRIHDRIIEQKIKQRGQNVRS